jgi:hypothetical protein
MGLPVEFPVLFVVTRFSGSGLAVLSEAHTGNGTG